ncbi:phage tail protein [Sinorhizobium meliloti]|uniref:phage tail protein n=1 Tax=Rhizobium meliloti TaxID=382 RepID=UPI000FDAB2EE|nr:phage tail tape measure protein [Sinorhizobium meliloti]RVG20297.1 phage tail tape measure protein [Sinorhizobium meliloti]
MAGSAVIGALRVNLGIDSAAFSNGLKQAQSGLSRFGSMAKTGLLAVGAAATAVGGALAVGVKGAVDAADDMSKAAAKIGIPIEELSRLKYAADLSGVSFEGLQTSVGRLSKVMTEAKNGSASAIEKFNQLGVTVTNADGSLKSTSQVLSEMADRFAAMPDGAEKTALAMELMGRSGANMIPLLNGGSAALQNLMNEADTFGQVFTAEMGANAEAFNDNISRLQGTFGAIAAEVAGKLLPHMVAFTDWLVNNAPAIANFVVQIVDFAAQIVALGNSIINLMTGAWAQFEAGWGRIIELRNQLVASLQGLAEEIVGVFVAIPGQMLEIGGQIIDGLWRGIQQKWEEVKGGLAEIGHSITNTVKSTLGIHSPSRVMHEVGTFIVQGLANGITATQPNALAAANGVSSTVMGAFDGMDQIGSSLSSSLSGVFQGLIDGSKSVKDVLKDLLGQMSDMVMNQAFQAIFGGGGMGGGGGGLFGGLFGGIGKLFGFANGGSFQVGGAGGVDSQLVAFKASPNETVSITKPGQEGGGGAREVLVRVGVDPKNGSIQPYVDSSIEKASPRIVATSVAESNRQAPGAMARYQQTKAGGDYR